MCLKTGFSLLARRLFLMSRISRGFGIHGNEANVFKWCTRASRGTLYLSSASVIWYNVSFGQFHTYRPFTRRRHYTALYGHKLSEQPMSSPEACPLCIDPTPSREVKHCVLAIIREYYPIGKCLEKPSLDSGLQVELATNSRRFWRPHHHHEPLRSSEISLSRP